MAFLAVDDVEDVIITDDEDDEEEVSRPSAQNSCTPHNRLSSKSYLL